MAMLPCFLYRIFSVIVFLIIPNYTCAKKELTDFEKIEQGYDCDPKCWFRELEVNSTTMSKWPVNCTDVCGILNFDQNSDLTVFELQEYFKNFKVLKGAMTFYNTQYASIEFFSSLEQVHCDVLNYFSFAYNRNLEVLNFGNLTNITCNFYAYNNTILDATSFCEKYGDLTIMFVYSNYKSCKGCIADHFYNTNIDQFQGCTSIVNAMWFSWFFTDYDPPIDMSPLNDIQNISGALAFVDTDFKNFSFFESLENLKSNQYLDYDINIVNCRNLTRFEIPSLKTITTTRNQFLMNVEVVHDDFCFTTTEMHFFLENNVKFDKLQAKYCVNDTLDSTCFFDSMSDLDTNCTEILGSVIVKTGDEKYKDKLSNLKNIYGSLKIDGTNFTDLGFLGNLEYVAILNESTTPLQIISNKNLQNATLPSLKRVLSKTKYQVSFQDNGRSFLNSSACLDFMDKLFDTNVVFDGKECEVIDRANQNDHNNYVKRMLGVSNYILIICIILLI